MMVSFILLITASSVPSCASRLKINAFSVLQPGQMMQQDSMLPAHVNYPHAQMHAKVVWPPEGLASRPIKTPRSATIAMNLSTSQPDLLPLKQAIGRLAAETTGGSSATDDERKEAAALIAQLEQNSPSGTWEERGPLIDGVWDLVYTDNPSAGTVWSDGRTSRRKLKGAILGRHQQVVTFSPPSSFQYAQRVRSHVALGLQVEMRASVEAQSDGISWIVSFQDVTWSLLGGRIRLRRTQLPSGSGGMWRTTFLDGDTRILRSQSNRGGPPTTYVLVKVQ